MDPRTPVQADHRYLQKVVGVVLGGKVEHLPSEFDRLSRAFQKSGGSWERVFHGSPKDVSLLKDLIVAAYKHGFLTKKESWSKPNGGDQSDSGDE